MKKKLVAVAVAGVLGAPLAANAQTATVTLYGRLNITQEFVKGATCAAAGVPSGNNPCPAGNTNPTVSRLSSNSSRFGLRGTESLGGGLSAIFQIESSINGDTNAGNLGGRETFVGFQGSWGTFKMGHFLMPLDDMHPIFGNVPTYTTPNLSTGIGVDCVDRHVLRTGHAVQVGRRLRCAPRQFAALRLAVVQRLHVQRPDRPARWLGHHGCEHG